MRQIGMLVIISAVAVVSACVTSLQPLYSENTSIFEPALIGTWVSEDAKDTCVISQSGEKIYDVVDTQDGTTGKFQGNIIKLGDRLFLDTYPEDPDIKNDFYKAHIILAHIFSRISLDGDSLQFAILDDQWLGDQLDSGSVNIGHTYLGNDIVLTASTVDLQDFVAKNAANDDAFPDPAIYHRKR